MKIVGLFIFNLLIIDVMEVTTYIHNIYEYIVFLSFLANTTSLPSTSGGTTTGAPNVSTTPGNKVLNVIACHRISPNEKPDLSVLPFYLLMKYVLLVTLC